LKRQACAVVDHHQNTHLASVDELIGDGVERKASGEQRGWQGSCGGLGRARFPIPGQKLIKVLDSVIGDPVEHVGEPRLRIDVVEFRCLCRSPNYAERACFPQDSR
jgi:hypothetical protein